tara:strand:- start:736 stop:1110 length:375 start_codon:yes stop_codon:yes gene_type:complete
MKSSESDSQIMMSDSLVGEVDMSQFYKDSDFKSDLLITLWVGGIIVTQPVTSVRITKKRINARFYCEPSQAFQIILNEEIDSLQVCQSSGDMSLDLSSCEVLSKSISISSSEFYECRLVVKLES